MTEWINLKERLPESTQWVLVWDGDISFCQFVKIADKRYKKGAGYFSPSDDCYVNDVTHWMPLPSPPIENIRCEWGGTIRCITSDEGVVNMADYLNRKEREKSDE